MVLVEAAAQLVAEGDQLAGPGLLLGVVDLAVHGRGRGVGPLGVAEHVQLGEADPLDHGHGGGELPAGLPREADDHVGGQPEAGDLGLGMLDPVEELGDAVGAVHGRQDLVVAGLEGDVQVAADLGVVADPGHQRRGHLHRQDAGQAQAQQPVDRRQPVDQPGQGVLLAPVVAVLAQVDAGEHDLADAPADLAADVVEDLLFGVGAERAAGPGDDAEGAPLVAAGLGLDRHPGAQPLGRGRPDHQRQPADLGHGGDQLGQPVLAVVVDHQVDPGDGPDRLGVGDRVAAGDDHGGLRVGLGRLADQPARGGGRLPGHGAGVDHHHVGGLAGVGQVEAARPQRLQGLLALGLVEPAPEGLEGDLGRGGRGRLSHCRTPPPARSPVGRRDGGPGGRG